MGITLGQLRARLIGELDVIPASSTKDRINDALREIYDDHEWGFLFTDGFIRTPELIEGTASVTKFSAEVIVDANIASKIDATHEFDIDIFEKQFRSLSAKEVDRGFTYKIVDWDTATNKLTIDPFYQDVTNAAAKVQILKIYYKPPYFQPPYEKGVDPVPDPVIDFKRFEYVISPQFNRRLNLTTSWNELQRYDPYREIPSEPRFLISHSYDTKFLDSEGTRVQIDEPVFEMYPAPRFARVFRVRYLRAGFPLLNERDQAPELFTKDLILEKAKVESYVWAKANADKLKLKTVGRFDNLIALAANKYQKLLEDAKKKDEERFPKANIGNYYNYPEYEWDNLECMGETLLLNF